MTNNFPEFTSRVCPALCEAACICGLHDSPVTTRDNENFIIEQAFASGLMEPHPPCVRSEKHVAVIGSGPAGLACAAQLNLRGHHVTVFEKADRPGGLLMYGIPNMKLDKSVIERRIRLMEAEGIEFRTGVEVGRDRKASSILRKYDAVVLACGAGLPRDLDVPGRDAGGVHFAVEYLTHATRAVLSGDPDSTPVTAKDRDVLIIGGGDTGNDCVATAVRQGAKSITQLEITPRLPDTRAEDNPWPQWPRICKTDYGQEEAAAVFGQDPRVYETTVQSLEKDGNGQVSAAKLVHVEWTADPATGRRSPRPVEGSEWVQPAQLVIIAAGFLGAQREVPEAFGTPLDARCRVETLGATHATADPKVFTAGDMRTGQSLVVHAIADGRAAAREVDLALMGYTNLP